MRERVSRVVANRLLEKPGGLAQRVGGSPVPEEAASQIESVGFEIRGRSLNADERALQRLRYRACDLFLHRVARGGKTETLEGSWSPKRLVILEFPSMDRARAWWASKEYAEAKGLRQACAATEMMLLEGVQRPQG